MKRKSVFWLTLILIPALPLLPSLPEVPGPRRTPGRWQRLAILTTFGATWMAISFKLPTSIWAWRPGMMELAGLRWGNIPTSLLGVITMETDTRFPDFM